MGAKLFDGVEIVLGKNAAASFGAADMWNVGAWLTVLVVFIFWRAAVTCWKPD